ncbi:armadillo-type protein [Rhodotorula diobovata]|uniref:Armadillo-type protein n=1 Tax=Rhodotorula diobovata TaxID=5288 RepID=A0A5C5FU32_9BASI|nr:armadillo-type protein [Rhodotorula diobovata]
MAAPPSSPNDVLEALAHALSPDPSSRKHAADLLAQWALLPGYYSHLVNAIHAREHVPAQIRQQAAIQLKNGVDRYWRRGALHAISPAEKDQIRPRLVALVDESDRVVAKNFALTVGKVARLDYGTEWDFPHTLLGSVQAGFSHPSPSTGLLILNRSLLFLHAAIKQLSSNRMPKGRALMLRLADILFAPLRQLHAQVLQQAVQRIQAEGLAPVGESAGQVDEMECALLAFKSLRYLLLYGYSDPSARDEPRDFFRSSVATLSSLLSLRQQLLASPSSRPAHSTPRLEYLTKHVLLFGKMYRALNSHNAGHFAAMDVALQLEEVYFRVVEDAAADVATLVDDNPLAPYPTRLVVQALLLLKSLLGDWDGSTGLAVPPGFVQQLAHLLITRMLPLRQDDLDKWTEDPEEWMNEEEAERWEFELRPCAEYVLRALLAAFKDELGPSVAGLLQRVSAPQDMAGLLLKEAVYTAVGRSPSDLEASINFKDWLENVLAPECAGEDSAYRLIRRRIAWLLGNWIGEDLAASSRSLIYQLLVHLVSRNASTDAAIRLTAARSLARCDTWDFDQDAFVPLLPRAIDEIVQLLGEVELSDSRMRLNETLGVVIDRVGQHISPYAPQLAEILATLWASTHENHFQTSILVTFTKLAEALGEQSQGLHPQACPIIQLSVDPLQPSHVYLQEDGLELWQVLLRRSSVLSPEMLQLVPALVSLLANGTDALPRCLAIFESYLLLDAPRVLEICATDFFSAIRTFIEGLALESLKVVLHALNTAFQTAPPQCWAAALDASGCFDVAVKVVSAKDTSALITTKYLCALARVILASPETFHHLVAASAARAGVAADTILDAVLSQFVDRLDNMSQGGQRKLAALALAYLIPTTNPVVLGRLTDLVSLWSSVLALTEESEGGDAELYANGEEDGGYAMPDDYQSDVEVDYTETLETTRRAALSARDPIRTHPLKTTIGAKLSEAQALNGGAEAFQANWLGRVDPLLVEELVQRLEGKLSG